MHTAVAVALGLRYAVIATGIGLHNAGVDGEILALDQSRRHRCPHHPLEDVAQQIAVAEATQPVLRERRQHRPKPDFPLNAASRIQSLATMNHAGVYSSVLAYLRRFACLHARS
jgi:hypothetical protein